MAPYVIDFAAREPHFFDHLAPIWAALDEHEHGTFYVPLALKGRAEAAGIDITVTEVGPSENITIVASWGDLRVARATGRRCIYSEHGAGQSYEGVTHGSYVGAPDRGGVVAVLVPSEQAARRHRAMHPTIKAFPVGCPRLDYWHTAKPMPAGQVVAISFHWNCTLVQETKSAFRHYERALRDLAAAFPTVLGHGHPRIIDRIRRRYTAVGIEVVYDFDEILERADVYAVDNSSTLFEFASTDRPVVVLNAPWYRRNIHHGLRFWDCADIGIQADQPADLTEAIGAALDDTPARRDRRAEIVDHVYAVHDGTATKHAVEAVRAIRDEWSG